MTVNFPTFYLLWANRQDWKVPAIHWRVIAWLEARGDLAVLMAFRGFGKSSVLDVWFAYKYYKDYRERVLLLSESDNSAYKSSRDVQNILRNHPLTQGMLPDDTGTVEAWWVKEARENDPRNPSMYARGAMSNITGARATEIVIDDAEVPRNISSDELRAKLRHRLSETVHIAVPGTKTLYVGTPHTEDSIYTDLMEMEGTDSLIIPMFEQAQRFEPNKEHTGKVFFKIPFTPVHVFSSIGKGAKRLKKGVDYKWDEETGVMQLAKPLDRLIDVYGETSWPERFNAKTMEKRRRETPTIGYWDSQYQLQARPLGDIRIDPNRLNEYDVDISYREANNAREMWLGSTQIVGCSCYWDVAMGKQKSDDSVLSVVLTDMNGHLFIHETALLIGEIATFNARKQIDGGQVIQIRDIVRKYNIPNVTVETAGVGSFAGKLLKEVLRGSGCGVTEVHPTGNKQTRILEAFEAPLSSRFLWARTPVCDGQLWQQMSAFDPTDKDARDDFIDATASAILQTPVRIGAGQRWASKEVDRSWHPAGQQFEAIVEY